MNSPPHKPSQIYWILYVNILIVHMHISVTLDIIINLFGPYMCNLFNDNTCEWVTGLAVHFRSFILSRCWNLLIYRFKLTYSYVRCHAFGAKVSYICNRVPQFCNKFSILHWHPAVITINLEFMFYELSFIIGTCIRFGTLHHRQQELDKPICWNFYYL